jgi:hypothetical protein
MVLEPAQSELVLSSITLAFLLSFLPLHALHSLSFLARLHHEPLSKSFPKVKMQQSFDQLWR